MLTHIHEDAKVVSQVSASDAQFPHRGDDQCASGCQEHQSEQLELSIA